MQANLEHNISVYLDENKLTVARKQEENTHISHS